MTFSDEMGRFTEEVERRSREVFVGVAIESLRSIQEGSEITGAPGQPVDTGHLKRSWQLQFEGPDAALISTNVVYAPGIEDGVDMRTGRALRFRSVVGGPHSVKLTEAGFARIVEHVLAQVGDG